VVIKPFEHRSRCQKYHVVVGSSSVARSSIQIQEHAGKPALPTISPFSFGRFGEF
jgi:hypothetical protein